MELIEAGERLDALADGLEAHILTSYPDPARPEYRFVSSVGVSNIRDTPRLVITIQPKTPQDMFDRLPKSYQGEEIHYIRESLE